MTNTGSPAPAARDFAAEYIAARTAARSGAILDQAAARRAAKIARDAERAGVALDEIALDETARLAANAARPVAPVAAPVARPFWL
jgi:hypothetical protein